MTFKLKSTTFCRRERGNESSNVDINSMGKNSGNDQWLDCHAAKYCVGFYRLRTLLFGCQGDQNAGQTGHSKAQGKRILFLKCLLDMGFKHLVLMLINL